MTLRDTIDQLLNATIQHGPLNNRIYLMHINDAEPSALIPALGALAKEKGYTKIFAKVPAAKAGPFFDAGYRKEAEVAGFFQGQDDAVFACAYFDDARRISPVQSEIDRVTTRAKNAAQLTLEPLRDLSIRQAEARDIPHMARLYQSVFQSYPFPIQDPDYLAKTMASHVDYFLVEDRGVIAALSSAEMDIENRNVEMTDFATHPRYRGRRLAVHLLAHMETAMQRKGIISAYTIARAVSYPMNLTFARRGFVFGGLLINNTNISGGMESMTVWHKPLLSV